MANSIHSTAIIGPNVQMGDDNTVGPHVVIEEGVTLGHNNRIWAGAYLCTGTTLGDSNEIHMGAVIGHTPQDVAYKGAKTFTKIGNHNIIREYVTIHRGTKEGTATTIGDHNFLMNYVHIAHNGNIGNHVTMVPYTGLAGCCTIEDEVFLSGMVGLHQFTRVGRLAIISALSAVNKDVPPFMLCGGRPAVVQGLNTIGLRRAGIGPAEREDIKRAFRLLYRSSLNVTQALAAIEEECRSAEAAQLVAFVRASERGICAAQAEEIETLLSRKLKSSEFEDEA